MLLIEVQIIFTGCNYCPYGREIKSSDSLVDSSGFAPFYPWSAQNTAGNFKLESS